MNKANFQKAVLGLLTTFALVGCGPSMKTNESATSSNGVSSSSAPSIAAIAEWNKLAIDGAVEGGTFDKASVLELDKINKALVVKLPLVSGVFGPGELVNVKIKQLPGSKLTLETSTTGQTSLVLNVPLETVLKGVNFLPSTALPNGDPLPAIPDGELPGLAIQLGNNLKTQCYLYLSPTIVAMFVELPFDPMISLTFPIRNKAKTRTFGYLSSVPAKNNAKGGLFLSVALPDDLARIIDNYL